MYLGITSAPGSLNCISSFVGIKICSWIVGLLVHVFRHYICSWIISKYEFYKLDCWNRTIFLDKGTCGLVLWVSLTCKDGELQELSWVLEQSVMVKIKILNITTLYAKLVSVYFITIISSSRSDISKIIKVKEASTFYNYTDVLTLFLLANYGRQLWFSLLFHKI